VALADSEPE
jgi:hypothetical protein